MGNLTISLCFLCWKTGDDEDLLEEEYDPVSSGSKSSKGKSGAAGKQEQFKGHLNGLYDGLAKIMTKTCNIEPVKNPSACAIENVLRNYYW